MARVRYYVLKDGDRWKVRLDDKDYPYATQQDAMNAARDAAKSTFAKGLPSQVLIQGRDGKWQTEWTYGDDPERSPG